MRKHVSTLVLLICLATPAFAATRPQDDVKAARAEVAVLPHSDVQGSQAIATVPRGLQDFRDSAALVLVGTMLLGLAAAVRRTV